MTRKALLIGINYKNTTAELKGCLQDIVNIKKFLMDELKFQESEIRMMSEESEPNNKPYRANILEAFKWLVQDNGPESRLFLHYSGHGSSIRDISGDEADGKDETICPLDYQSGMIIDDQLNNMLAKPLKAGAQLFCIFDCCHSGTCMDLRHNYQVSTQATSTSYTVTSDNHYQSTEGRVICLSGCAANDFSSDAFLEGKAQGAMSFSFLKTYEKLKNDGKPLTYKRLMKNLLIFIKQKGFTQVPQISSGQFMDLGEEIKIV